MEDEFKLQIMVEAGTHIQYVKVIDVIKLLDIQVKAIKSDNTKEVLEHIKSEFIKFL